MDIEKMLGSVNDGIAAGGVIPKDMKKFVKKEKKDDKAISNLQALMSVANNIAAKPLNVKKMIKKIAKKATKSTGDPINLVINNSQPEIKIEEHQHSKRDQDIIQEAIELCG